MKKSFSQSLTQKILMTLFMGLCLGGCTVDFGSQDSAVADSTIWSNLDRTYYSIVDGAYDTATYSSLSFDTDKSRLIISNVVNGEATSPEWYYMELLETRGSTNGAFQLYGNNYGKLHDMFMGVSILSNQDGSFVKWHMQDREDCVLDIVISSTDYNFASDEMIFRPHKKHLNETAYKVDENGVAISGGDSFIATIDNPGEYVFNEDVINTNSTILYVLDDSAVEVMTKDDGSYVVIEYDNKSTKMKKLELDSTFKISKASVVSELASVTKVYGFVEAPLSTSDVWLNTAKDKTFCEGLYTYSSDGMTLTHSDNTEYTHYTSTDTTATYKSANGDSINAKSFTVAYTVYVNEFSREHIVLSKGDESFYLDLDVSDVLGGMDAMGGKTLDYTPLYNNGSQYDVKFPENASAFTHMGETYYLVTTTSSCSVYVKEDGTKTQLYYYSNNSYYQIYFTINDVPTYLSLSPITEVPTHALNCANKKYTFTPFAKDENYFQFSSDAKEIVFSDGAKLYYSTEYLSSGQLYNAYIAEDATRYINTYVSSEYYDITDNTDSLPTDVSEYATSNGTGGKTYTVDDTVNGAYEISVSSDYKEVYHNGTTYYYGNAVSYSGGMISITKYYSKDSMIHIEKSLSAGLTIGKNRLSSTGVYTITYSTTEK